MLDLYLAGPMRKRANFNFPAFFKGANDLRDTGRYRVFNPAEQDVNSGFEWQGKTGHEDLAERMNFDLREALGTDLAFICKEADGVALLPGWEDSKGARAEVAAAEALGLPVRTVEEWLAVALEGAA